MLQAQEIRPLAGATPNRAIGSCRLHVAKQTIFQDGCDDCL